MTIHTKCELIVRRKKSYYGTFKDLQYYGITMMPFYFSASFGLCPIQRSFIKAAITCTMVQRNLFQAVFGYIYGIYMFLLDNINATI